jgi:hypothetical protein
MDCPLDVLRSTEVVYSPPTHLPETIYIAAVKAGPSRLGFAVASNRITGADMVAGDRGRQHPPGLLVHTERVGLDVAGDDRLAQSHAGFEQHLAMAAVVRIACKEHARHVGGHKALHDHGHGHAGRVDSVLAEIGQGPRRIEARPASSHRFQKCRVALDVQERIVLSCHRGDSAVLGGCRRANRNPPSAHRVVCQAQLLRHGDWQAHRAVRAR